MTPYKTTLAYSRSNLSDATIPLLIDLVKRPSVTPNDSGCQPLIAEQLTAAGFTVQHYRFGEVDNLWATHGNGAPLTVLAGHTDVVPVGDDSAWTYPPFSATIKDGILYGRGAADMKAGVAASVIALIDFVKTYPNHLGTVALMLTSDEEGPAQNGIKQLMPTLDSQGIKIDYAIFTEPSCETLFADTLKNGRRGSLHALVKIMGKQGHIAYPHLAANPIHAAGPIISALSQESWCEGNAYFPPTSMQMWSVAAGVGADNVIPATLDIGINFRYSTEVTANGLQARTRDIIESQLAILNAKQTVAYQYELAFRLSGKPFLTPVGELTEYLQDACQNVCDRRPVLSCSGGTSDARFVAPYGAQVVEFGVRNHTIHQVNECVELTEVAQLQQVLFKTLAKLYQLG